MVFSCFLSFLFLLSLSSAKRGNTISRVIYTKLTQKELDWGALRWFCLVGLITVKWAVL